MCRKLLYVILYFNFFAVTNAFACSNEKSKKEDMSVKIVRKDSTSFCTWISIEFPQRIGNAQGGLRMGRFKGDGHDFIFLMGSGRPVEKKINRNTVSVCLSESNLKEASLTVMYPIPRNDNKISLCNNNINIENLYDYIEKNNDTDQNLNKSN